MTHQSCRFLFLGTGGSLGIPRVRCSCSVCTSSSSYNKRTRPGALLKIGDKRLLLDAGPDFRTQALDNGIDALDGVIISHAHHDHTAGIDDLRVYCEEEKSLPCLMSQETYDDLKIRYAYIFNRSKVSLSLVPAFTTQILQGNEGSVEFEGVPIQYVTFTQADMPVNGFRLGNLAFLSDIKIYDESIFSYLQGLDVLIISALRFTPSALHFTVDEAIDFARETGAKQVWFTHIAHELDHEQTNAYLPPHIRVAYDGLEIPFTM